MTDPGSHSIASLPGSGARDAHVAQGRRAEERGLIGRRHVIYVEGYDPQGAEGYYGLFERSWKRFLGIWRLQARLGELRTDSQLLAHWDIDTSGPNWRVVTRYDFLRQEHFIRANLAEPLPRQIVRALGWTLDYLVSGAILKVLRASWAFGSALVLFQTLLIGWIALSAGVGWLVALGIGHILALPVLVAFPIGVAGAILAFLALRPLARRWFVIQVNNHWPYLCAFARGEATCFDAVVEAGAQRLIAAAQADEAEEIVVIGHSGGGALAPAIIVRALELDPEVGRRGPSVVLLTLGSIAPGAALHPEAKWLRAVFARLAVEPSVAWVDAQSRLDVLNFWDFDPVAGIGVEAGSGRCNPIVWRVRFRDLLSPDFFRRMRFNFFRLHFQFVMANDRRAPYDYFMLVGGPLPVATWAQDPFGVFTAFDAESALAQERLPSSTATSAAPATADR